MRRTISMCPKSWNWFDLVRTISYRGLTLDWGSFKYRIPYRVPQSIARRYGMFFQSPCLPLGSAGLAQESSGVDWSCTSIADFRRTLRVFGSATAARKPIPNPAAVGNWAERNPGRRTGNSFEGVYFWKAEIWIVRREPSRSRLCLILTGLEIWLDPIFFLDHSEPLSRNCYLIGRRMDEIFGRVGSVQVAQRYTQEV